MLQSILHKAQTCTKSRNYNLERTRVIGLMQDPSIDTCSDEQQEKKKSFKLFSETYLSDVSWFFNGNCMPIKFTDLVLKKRDISSPQSDSERTKRRVRDMSIAEAVFCCCDIMSCLIFCLNKTGSLHTSLWVLAAEHGVLPIQCQFLDKTYSLDCRWTYPNHTYTPLPRSLTKPNERNTKVKETQTRQKTAPKTKHNS